MADISDNTKKRYESDRFLYTRTKYVYDYALETWYPQLKHATLESQFIQLTLEEMEALYHSCLDKMHNSADTKKTTDKDKEILQEVNNILVFTVFELLPKVFPQAFKENN